MHDLAAAIRCELTTAQSALTAAQGKLSEMLRQAGELDMPEGNRGSFMNGPVTAQHCLECGCAPGVHAADCSRVRAQVSDQEEAIDG